MFQNIGEIALLFWRTLCALPFAWRQRQKVYDQFFEIGNASLLMVCVLSFFIGAVIALQTGPVLVERSLASAVGGIPLQVLHERTGLLSRSIEGAAFQTVRLLDNADLRHDLGVEGRAHVRENFLHTREVRDYLAVFASLL